MEEFNNAIINITYVLKKIKVNEEDNIEINIKGTIVYFNNRTFIISIHNGFPIEKIVINDRIFKNFIICAWCDLVIIPYEANNGFVFRYFVKKHMEPTDKYFVNSTKIKYINNIFTNIGFIPENPIIMYNCLKSNENIDTGMPIINEKQKLAGIVSRINLIDKDNDNYLIYCVPINYILKALMKKDNTKIYSLNEDISNIIKINNFKTICGKIYCILHKMYISVDSYIAINGDINTSFYIKLENGREKKSQLVETNNEMINNNLIINKNNIKLSYGLIALLDAMDESELLEDLLINKINNIKWNNYIINLS
jgi:hypothetical protein